MIDGAIYIGVRGQEALRPCVLNYMVTSNHTHLLVKDTGANGIAESMQLIAGRTESNRGQVFNLALLGLVDASIHR